VGQGIQRVAIVGGGFSGAMLAARLAERGLGSTVIDRTGRFGLGVAYSTPFEGHLLNVRSSRMSAVDDRPDDFVNWLKVKAPGYADPIGFAPRRVYGRYVQERFSAVLAAWPERIVRVVGEAAALEDGRVRLEDGRDIGADAVVLATGNPPPRTTSDPGSNRIIADPWAIGALDQIGLKDDVIIIGAGLTMVDLVLWLQGRGWRGRAVALSRRGLKPRAHGTEPEHPIPPTDDLVSGPASRRLRAARRLSSHDWRRLMEGLRPVTAELWSQADIDIRSRWLRHLRPWWDVHRHRIAEPIAAVLEGLEDEGRLRILAGRLGGALEDQHGVAAHWRSRGGGPAEPLRGRWLIDCSGPGHDPAQDALTGPLIADGRARLDPLRLGLDLDAVGRVLDRSGRPNPRLLVLGPPARAAFWETIAVPDIRRRIEDVAAALSA